jgi:hypothetical protein
MSLQIQIICDNCGDSGTRPEDRGKLIREIRELAREDGWQHISGKDFCPTCINKINNQE